MKVVETKTNSKGIVYAIMAEGEFFEVWKLSENYCGRVRGGISKSWRYVERGLCLEDAQKLLKRRTK